jgi:hypothetical protein
LQERADTQGLSACDVSNQYILRMRPTADHTHGIQKPKFVRMRMRVIEGFAAIAQHHHAIGKKAVLEQSASEGVVELSHL